MPSRPTGQRNQWRTATCDVCGKTFQTSRYDTSTCGPTCRSAKSRAAKKHNETRAELVWLAISFCRGDHGPLTPGDIDGLKVVEKAVRECILNNQEQLSLDI